MNDLKLYRVSVNLKNGGTVDYGIVPALGEIHAIYVAITNIMASDGLVTTIGRRVLEIAVKDMSGFAAIEVEKANLDW